MDPNRCVGCNRNMIGQPRVFMCSSCEVLYCPSCKGGFCTKCKAPVVDAPKR